MLLAEIDVPRLKDVSSPLWKRPLDSDVARFYFCGSGRDGEGVSPCTGL